MQQNPNGAPRRRYVPDQQPQSYRQQGYRPQYQQPTYQPQAQQQYQQPTYQQPTYQQTNYQQYQQPTYQQPTYQQQPYQTPVYQAQPHQQTQSEPHSFIQQRNKLLMVSGIIAVIWFIVVCSSFASLMSATPTGSEAEQLGQEIGTALGFMLQIPFLITSFLALVFNTLGWLLSKKGFALTAGILFSVSFFFSIGNGFGYIPCLVLCFMGYSKLKKMNA